MRGSIENRPRGLLVLEKMPRPTTNKDADEGFSSLVAPHGGMGNSRENTSEGAHALKHAPHRYRNSMRQKPAHFALAGPRFVLPGAARRISAYPSGR